MTPVIISHTPKLVVLLYLMMKVWDLLPNTLVADLPELTLYNIILLGLSIAIAYFTTWLWVCPMNRVRGVRTLLLNSVPIPP